MSNLMDYRSPCPVIFFERAVNNAAEKQVFTIHCHKLEVDIECYVSTAIIRLKGQWTNRTNQTIDCVFMLPTTGVMMNVTLKVGTDKVVTSAIVSKEEADELVKSKGKKQDITPEGQSPYEQYVPDLFRLPFGDVKSGDTVELECQYLETLNYYKNKGFVVNMPLYFPGGTIVENAPWDKVVSLTCKINALTEFAQVDCKTHNVDQAQTETGGVVLKMLKCKPQSTHNSDGGNEPLSKTGRDFECSFKVETDDIMSMAVRNTSPTDETMHNVCVFVTPPAAVDTTFGRAFFFVLDRSGSMVGEPYQEATRALFRALDTLRVVDQFTICAFDHRQQYFKGGKLVQASRESVMDAKTWIQQYQPERGGTVMFDPVKEAIHVLEASQLLPFIFLITDGAVHDERQICEFVEQQKNLKTRIFTLGIGSYCNWFFLKMLAQIGRGFADVVAFREHIFPKIDHLTRIAQLPVLTDMELGKPKSADEFEIYPFPIPDLFVGAPLVVAAQFRHKNPHKLKSLKLRGYKPDTESQELTAMLDYTPHLPVEKMFVKQKIDLLTARAWFTGDKKIEKEVVETSVANSMPSQFTTMLAYETSRADYDRQQRQQQEAAESKEADAPPAEDEKDDADSKDKEDKKNKKNVDKVQFLKDKMKNNKGTVAAMAVGGTIAIVAVSFATFGDVQATMDNMPSFDGAFENMDLGEIDADCCGDDCCGDCDDCGDCGDCGDCSVM